MFISDLQLDVKGCRDVYASFDKYVEVERLEGDNKYHAEEHGLQVGCWFMLVNCRLGIPLNFLPASLSSFVAAVAYFCFRMCLLSKNKLGPPVGSGHCYNDQTQNLS